jgi:hypothetical protein
MKDEDLDLDGDPLLSALARLPREDLDSARRERTRREAHRELALRVRRQALRPGAQLARLYERVLEPALLATYGILVLGRAAAVLGLLAK